MKVDFIIVGAQKCATTTLFDLLNSHSEFEGCYEKEPNFFSYNDWRGKVNQYHALFTEKKDVKYFEATTNYTFNPHIENKNIVNDLFEYNENLKIIYMVRRPLDRVVSSYMHGRQSGYIEREINTEIKENYFFINITKYYHQIMPYINKFGKSNVMVIDFDDFILDQEGVVESVMVFLGVMCNCDGSSALAHENSSINTVKPTKKYKSIVNLVKSVTRSLPAPIRNLMKNSYHKMTFMTGDTFKDKPKLSGDSQCFILSELESDIKEMEIILGKPLDSWKSSLK